MTGTKTAEELETAVEVASSWCRSCGGKLAISCEDGKFYCFMREVKPDCAGYEARKIRQKFPSQRKMSKISEAIHYTCNFKNESLTF